MHGMTPQCMREAALALAAFRQSMSTFCKTHQVHFSAGILGGCSLVHRSVLRLHLHVSQQRRRAIPGEWLCTRTAPSANQPADWPPQAPLDCTNAVQWRQQILPSLSCRTCWLRLGAVLAGYLQSKFGVFVLHVPRSVSPSDNRIEGCSVERDAVLTFRIVTEDGLLLRNSEATLHSLVTYSGCFS